MNYSGFEKKKNGNIENKVFSLTVYVSLSDSL